MQKKTVEDQKISLTDWGAVAGMAGVFVLTIGLLFLSYIYGWYSTMWGGILVPLAAIFAVWTVVEIVLAIMSGVRVKDGMVRIARKKIFKAQDILAVSVADASGNPAKANGKAYKNPELIFRLTQDRTFSVRLSRLSCERLDKILETFGVELKD